MISPRGFFLLNQEADHHQQPPKATATPSAVVSPTIFATPFSLYKSPAKAPPLIKRRAAMEISLPPLTTTLVTNAAHDMAAATATPLEIPRSPRCPRRGSRNVSSRPRKPRPRDVHPPDALPRAVAALLAITDIPSRRRSQSSSPLSSCSSSVANGPFQPRRRVRNDSNASLARNSLARNSLAHTPPPDLPLFSDTESMPELSILGPLDVLLSPPPTDDEDALFSGSDTTPGVGSWAGAALSPSLSTDSMSSLGSCSPDPASPASGLRTKRFRPLRQELEMVSPCLDGHPEPEIHHHHPLARATADGMASAGAPASPPPPDSEVGKLVDNYLGRTIRPFKSAFKSNLSASLRVIRSAARSISTLNFPAIPPDDFLSRSILGIDPSVPYTDERRPPVLEETPPPALRRYLNPTSDARITDPRPGTKTPAARTIPMQTYKVEHSHSCTLDPPSAAIRMRDHLASSSSSPAPPPAPAQALPPSPLPPALRPREMRENPDFIRIAVMEMAMRKNGKLDGNKPGRARWALPPRACTNKPYPVCDDGVPERWVPVTPEH